MRGAAYVDGLNLYYGMRDDGLLAFRWLDVVRMCQLLADDAGGVIQAPIAIERVTYCTSLVNDKQARSRQDTYLQALQAHQPQLEVLLGTYDYTT
jgi:hypothetical protein